MPHIKLERAILCLDCDTLGLNPEQCSACSSTAVYPLARFLNGKVEQTEYAGRTIGLPADVKAFLLSPQAETLVEVVERVQGPLNRSVAQARGIVEMD